ncbi:RNA-binding protein [Candidatus Aerophobetes bacterium]|nr:RNA-binding protein [Candidatus Aerophobetes bacterium]
MSKKLYVGNLSYKATEDDLKDLFKEFTTVTEVKLVTDRDSGKSRGFGFVEFSSGEDADRAVKSLNGKMFQEREMIVNEARPRKNSGFRRY